MEKAKILVVDDDAIVLASCQRVLVAEGFAATLVASANEALAALEGGDFDLLLVDVKMPGRDGVWLTREVRKRWPGIPVVAMSGYPTPETIIEGFESGAATFLAKPFIPDELIEAVRKALKREIGDEETPSVSD